MAKKQFYGVKFPFTAQDEENYYLDANKTLKDKVRSLLMHVIFTPKGQKLRDPEFGTDLIKFLFEPNESETWENIKMNVSESINRYVSNITLNNIEVVVSEDEPRAIYVKVSYTVSNGITSTKDSFITKI